MGVGVCVCVCPDLRCNAGHTNHATLISGKGDPAIISIQPTSQPLIQVLVAGERRIERGIVREREDRQANAKEYKKLYCTSGWKITL